MYVHEGNQSISSVSLMPSLLKSKIYFRHCINRGIIIAIALYQICQTHLPYSCSSSTCLLQCDLPFLIIYES
ncbi:hypothetical protein GBAR_LOCUS16379, partial [Geodia barretti]